MKMIIKVTGTVEITRILEVSPEQYCEYRASFKTIPESAILDDEVERRLIDTPNLLYSTKVTDVDIYNKDSKKELDDFLENRG